MSQRAVRLNKPTTLNRPLSSCVRGEVFENAALGTGCKGTLEMRELYTRDPKATGCVTQCTTSDGGAQVRRDGEEGWHTDVETLKGR